MPAASILPLAKKAGKSPAEAEKLWGEAKQAARKAGHFKKDGDDFYAYTMGIFKRMLGLETSSLEEKLIELAASAKAAPTVKELKSRCDEIAAELRRRKIPVVRVEYPTRQYEGAVIVLENARWVLAVQIPDMKWMQVELTNRRQDFLQSGKKVKTYRDLLASIKSLLAKSKEKVEKPVSGVKKAVDRTTRKDDKLPSFGGSATKMRNWLVKNFNGKAIPMTAFNNPYSDVQHMAVILPRQGMTQMLNILKNNGHHPKQMQYSRSGKGREVTIEDVMLSWTPEDNKPFHIAIYGKKKAKRSTLPYYD